MNDLLVPLDWDFKRLFKAARDPASEAEWPPAARPVVRMLETQPIASLAAASKVSVRMLSNYAAGAVPEDRTVDALVEAMDCFNLERGLQPPGYVEWSNAMQSRLHERAALERAARNERLARERLARRKATATSAPHAPAPAPCSPPAVADARAGDPACADPAPALSLAALNALPLDVEWIIDRAIYGEGAQVRAIGGDELVTLPIDTTLFDPATGAARPMAAFAPAMREACEALGAARHLFFPRRFRVCGRKRDPAWTVRAHVCTDVPYGQGVDAFGGARFDCECFLGLGGIAAFLDERGRVRPRNASEPAPGLGCAAIVVAVAYEGGRPVCKSRYVLVVRKGIRYPEDVLFSAQGLPFASTPDDIPNARFFFQSRESKGNSTDLFAADFNGEYLCNLNAADESAWEGFTDQDGREIARWTEDGESVVHGSSAGGRGVAEVIVRADAFPRARRGKA